MLRLLLPVLALVATALPIATAHATPVATDDASYGVLGRIFPDPLAGCQPGVGVCSPNAQGNVPAGQFIGVDEFVDGIRFMNSKPEWQRYLEVLPLDGRMGENDGDAAPAATPGRGVPRQQPPELRVHAAPGVQVGRPADDDPRAAEVGHLRPARDRRDRARRPEAEVRHVALDPRHRARGHRGRHARGRGPRHRVHGAGPGRPAQGRRRSSRTARSRTPRPSPTCSRRRSSTSPTRTRTAGAAARSAPAASSSSATTATASTSTATGPTSASPSARTPPGRSPRSARSAARSRRSTASRRSTRASTSTGCSPPTRSRTRSSATAATTGRRTRASATTARNIHVVSEKALAWSPLIVPNDTPREQNGCVDAAGAATACARIYGQTWGTVYDTINYTVTGSLGDWLDSPFGIGADGLDNEMAFSHLDRNIVFDPQGEQLHVDGNKGLIYAQIASMLSPPDQRYDAPGLKGYVANARKTRAAEQLQPKPPEGTVRAGEDRGPERHAVRRRRRLPVRGQERHPARRRLARRRQERLQRRSARRHHEAQRAGHQRRRRRHDAQGAVPLLRRPPGRRARRRVGHRRRGLQPVARLRPGRPHRRRQPPAGQGEGRQEGRVARRPRVDAAEPHRRGRRHGRRVLPGRGDAEP